MKVSMLISIAERLRPFSHLPGTSTILPGCGYEVQIFPCLVRFYHLQEAVPVLLTELTFDLKGPIQQFTLCNDLEKGRLTISGITMEGWMRYHFISGQSKEWVCLLVDRAPVNGFPVSQGDKRYVLRDKEWLILRISVGDMLLEDRTMQTHSFEPYQVPPCERLSLGSHKAQEWELIKRRFNLTEILPLVHRVGQLVPSQGTLNSSEGTLSLLYACQESLTHDKPEIGEKKWSHFLLGCFNSLLVPQLEERNYQGLVPFQGRIECSLSPLVILSEGSRLIRALFVRQRDHSLSILPYLLPCFSSGRLLDVPLEGGGSISLEWTKKTIRRLILYAGRDEELSLTFRSHVRDYLLRQHAKETGERKNCRSVLSLKKHCHYFLDNFQ